MKNIVVTGGSGRLGYYIIGELLEHGYTVISADRVAPKHTLCPAKVVDLIDMNQVLGLLDGADAIIHMAAIPSPHKWPYEEIYRNNVVSTYNILEAADRLGIRKAVIGSSESIYGFAYAKTPFMPNFFPMNEDHPLLPQDCYGLSKIANEDAAAMFNRRSGMQVVSMRMACVLSKEGYKAFRSAPSFDQYMMPLMWAYIDIHDAATACRLAIEADGLGALPLDICADDSICSLPTSELLTSTYPEVTDIRAPLEGYASLYSNQKAKSQLNWQPQHSWRMYV